ncbi:hypothetical protein MMC25_003358 [Agyrium rufum]|nr:hypothetical protein [Agyrium rufum]
MLIPIASCMRILKEPTGTPQLEWINNLPNEGMIRYMSLLNAERIMLTSPKALSEVIVTRSYEFIKPPALGRFIGRILGIGIITAEGDEHKKQRKNLMPAFAYRHIRDLVPTFWRLSGEMIQLIEDEVRTKAAASASESEKTLQVASIGLAGWISRATLDIIGEAGLGRSLGSLHNPDNEINRTYRNIFSPSGQARILGLLGIFLPPWIITMIPIKRNDDMNAASRKIRALARDLCVTKEKKLQAERDKVADIDILSVALKSGGFTVENLVDQAMTFLAAGHETTSSAVQWAMMQVGKNQEMQERLRTEIRSKLPSITTSSDPSSITAEALDNLPYLHAFCNEVLRVDTPVRITTRYVPKDTTIQGHFVPKGTEIMLPIGAVNQSIAQWGPDAKEFKPERWLAPGQANGGGAESNFSMLTFLHGPRGCIGQAFSRMEMQCLVAALVGRFKIELEDLTAEVGTEGQLTSKPKGGVEVKLTILEGW